MSVPRARATPNQQYRATPHATPTQHVGLTSNARCRTACHARFHWRSLWATGGYATSGSRSYFFQLCRPGSANAVYKSRSEGGRACGDSGVGSDGAMGSSNGKHFAAFAGSMNSGTRGVGGAGWQSVGSTSGKFFTRALSGRHLGWLSLYGSVSFPCHPRSGALPPSDRAIRVALWSCIPR